MPKRKKSTDRASKSAPGREQDADGRKEQSPTAVAAEALRTGVMPGANKREAEIPNEEEILAGDPDDDTLANEYSGENTPGGSSPTPDQNEVDEIGRAYGLQDEDSGELHSGEEVLERRDRHRSELNPPAKPES
jgi:Family of unknown function (DUF6335)